MTVSKTVSEEKFGFEKAFELVGGNGKFQWILTGILSLQMIFLTWNHMGYIFIGAVPSHWCKIPQLSVTNWTVDEIKEISIPKILDGHGHSDLNSKYESCSYYDLDYEFLATNFGENYEGALEHIAMTNETANVEKKACNNWMYDDSLYTSTIVTQFNLVCKNRFLTASVQSSYMIGGLMGTFIFGSLNDRVLGRRNSALVSIILVLLSGFAATMANSYWLFVSIRMIIAIGTSGCMQSASILILENCDIGSRAKFYCILTTFFGVGYGIMPIYAYFIRDWSMLQLAFSLSTLSLLSYFWIFPESPRWLASMGRDEEAVKALNKIAKINGKPMPDKAQLLSAIQACHNHHVDKNQDELKSSFMTNVRKIAHNFKSLVDTRERLKRALTVWTLFIAVAFVYYGFAFSTNLTSNPYLLVAMGGMMEIPANLAPLPFLSILGRRPTTAICYFMTGISAFAIVATPPEYETLRVIFSMVGKFYIAAAFTVIYLIIGEIFPTVVRTTGQATGTIMGRFGSITAPYFADLLTTVYPDLPCAIFGIVSILAAGIALLLPETRDMEMMDQVSEMELDKL